LKGYDYSLPGAYFITILCYNRSEIFGEIGNGELKLNKQGLIVAKTCEWLHLQYPHTEMEKFVVMPNHFHGILWIDELSEICKGGSRPALTETDVTNTYTYLPNNEQIKGKPVGQLIGAFKTVSAKQINLLRSSSGQPVWQRNYYDFYDSDFVKRSRIKNIN
jgi:REP element-mobilizing transposase RayT